MTPDVFWLMVRWLFWRLLVPFVALLAFVYWLGSLRT